VGVAGSLIAHPSSQMNLTEAIFVSTSFSAMIISASNVYKATSMGKGTL
jgi:hypothetical protein